MQLIINSELLSYSIRLAELFDGNKLAFVTIKISLKLSNSTLFAWITSLISITFLDLFF